MVNRIVKNNSLLPTFTAIALTFASMLAHADVPVIDALQYDANHSINNSSQVETAPPAAQQPESTSHLSLEQRVAILESQMKNQNQLNVPNQLDNMQQEIQALRGRIDVESHDLQTLQQQLQSMYQDLDTRVAKKREGSKFSSPQSTTALALDTPSQANKGAHTPLVSNTTTTSDVPTNANNNTNVNTAIASTGSGNHFLQEQDTYLIGYNNIKNHEYNKAIIAMQNYLQSFPKGQYAANAHYWLGELYLINNDSKKAIVQFQTVINNYPNDSKIADAKLKLGFIYYDNGQIAEAKKQLLAVKKEYPGTTVAQLASARLRDIR